MNGKLVVIICLFVLVVGVAVYFLMRTSADDESHKPGENPTRDIGALPEGVCVSKQSIKCSGGEVKVLTITNVARVLDCFLEKTGALALEAKLTRDENKEVAAVVWSRRAKMALQVKGFDSVTRSPYKLSADTGAAPGHPNYAENDKSGIVLMTDPRPPDSTDLLITVNGKSNTVDLGSGSYLVGPGTFMKNYPIAVFEKIKEINNVGHYVGYLVIDLESRRLIGEIPLPNDVSTASVSFVLDPTSNAIIAVEQNLNWLMVMDLAGLHATSKKESRNGDAEKDDEQREGGRKR